MDIKMSIQNGADPKNRTGCIPYAKFKTGIWMVVLWMLLTSRHALGQTTLANIDYASGTVVTVNDPVSIYASPSVIIESGANITFWTPAITLDPGFHAKPGSYFHAFLDGSVGSLQQTSVTPTTSSFSWTASSGSRPISYFNIFRNGVYIGATGNTSFSDTGLSPNSPYGYTITAIDTSGNASSSYLLNINTPGPTGTLPNGEQVVLVVPGASYFGIATGTWAISQVTPH
jgi:hypothetical protein